ncbi:MAG: hypothetical protein KK926_00315 [Methanomethylovorans sp.]|nr:hypothetical protein [Methanomethylovorans sp.]
MVKDITSSKKDHPVIKLKPVLHGVMLNENVHSMSKGRTFKNIVYY